LLQPREPRTHVGIIGALLVAVLAIAARLSAGPAAAVDAAFERFWAATNPQAAERAAAQVVRSGVTFRDALERLRRGRPYSATAPRGVVHRMRQSRGMTFYYDLDVPPDYDASRRYQVRVQLHGGVGGRATNDPRGDGSIGALAGATQIYVQPYAGTSAPWWSDAQLENVRAILDSVKRTYNVDENRVALAGVSDGATAAWYMAMRDTTPYASFVSLNGFFLVLGNPATGAQGDLFPNNWLNKPFFVVNGGADPLYPTRFVDTYMNALEDGGVEIDYRPQENAAHNTSWWPDLKDAAEGFVRDHPRNPVPASLTWETSGDRLSNRAHWLVIDRLASRRDLPPLPDLTEVLAAASEADQPPSPRLLAHMQAFGRVDLARTGNSVDVSSRGVAEFTLLLSPDAFDFAEPVIVTCNGLVVFNGHVEPSVATLLEWAARDNDRTMLFGAELHVKPEQP
jgi:acetyl esterase/lipase